MVKLWWVFFFFNLAYANLWLEPTKTCLKALEATSWSASTPLHAITKLLKHYHEGFFKGS